jgi:ABC-type sugar transport system permease subunit
LAAVAPQASPKRRRPRKPDEPGALTAVGQPRVTPYLLSVPAMVTITAILALPVLYGVWQSLYRPEALGLPA